MHMPLRVTRLVLGSLFVITKVLLKLKNLPDEDRKHLQTAHDSLVYEINALHKADEIVKGLGLDGPH